MMTVTRQDEQAHQDDVQGYATNSGGWAGGKANASATTTEQRMPGGLGYVGTVVITIVIFGTAFA